VTAGARPHAPPKATLGQGSWQKKLIPPNPKGSFYLFRRQFHTARPSGQGALDGADDEAEQTDCDRRLGASKKAVRLGAPVSRTVGLSSFSHSTS
jgi:hypothetical protein